MNKKDFFASIFMGSAIIVFALAFAMDYVAAQSEIQYPVKELGNCANEAACRIYCDKPENIKACVSFAEKNDLMSKEEIETAKNFIAAGTKGPGGCTGKENCEEYCNDVSRIDECISFAEKNNLIPPQELEEAKKVQAAIKRGVKPPLCKGKEACDEYCSEADHMEECITFGIEAGFIQGKELEDVQKMLAAVKRGIKPPPCKGKEACDEYCSNPDNMEMCMNFAMEAGFMTDQEKEGAQKMLQAIKKGVKPPACKGREECDVYCAEESHFEECMKFAEAAGFMSPEEAEMARKTGGKGPGNCKSKEECQSFCDNPDNQETCFSFAKENGMIPEADLQRMEQGKQQFKQAMQETPPEVYSCLESAVGVETMAKFKSGEAMPPKEIGDKMRVCFEQNIKPREPGGPGEGGSMPPAGGGSGMTGPGGCTGPEECQKYCESNQEECKNFKSPTPPMPGGTPGSGSTPCQGENCPPPGAGSGPGSAPGSGPSSGFMGAPCEGENCQLPPSGQQQPQPGQPPMQPGQQNPPEGGMTQPQGPAQPPPSTTPGGGENLQPGEYVPPAPPSGETTPPPPPTTEPPTSFLDSFLGLVLYPFILLLR